MSSEVSFNWGSGKPTRTTPGGIYIDKVNGYMYIQTDSNVLKFKGDPLLTLNVPETFAEASWEEISFCSQHNEIPSTWNVGDTKTIQLTTGENVELVILGFNHDDGAGITLGMKNCLNTTYPMNDSSTTTGGWKNSVMRTSTMNTLFNLLPADLQNVIVTVSKKTSADGELTTIDTTQDKLFLFSEVEVYGATSESVAGEGNQYEYFKLQNPTPNIATPSLVKTCNGSACSWWLRSPCTNYSDYFCIVTGNGHTSINDASVSCGVSFGFGV